MYLLLGVREIVKGCGRGNKPMSRVPAPQTRVSARKHLDFIVIQGSLILHSFILSDVVILHATSCKAAAA